MLADDEDIAARAILAAGGYEKFYMSHIACPGAEVFERAKPLNIPNYSLRMSALTAASLRPQLAELPARIEHANRCYELIRERLVTGAKEVRRRRRCSRCRRTVQSCARVPTLYACMTFLKALAGRRKHRHP